MKSLSILFRFCFRIVCSTFTCIQCLYFRLRVDLDGLAFGSRTTIGRKCVCAVPVISRGAGCVYIEDSVSFGFRKAPKFGNGEIMIQARKSDAIIRIGSETTFSNNISIIACKSVVIGKGCQIGDLVLIYDSDFHVVDPDLRKSAEGAVASVVIGDNVWLGSRVMILKGVSIGDGSVIAAGSVVIQSIPARSLAGGIPARIIKSI